MMRVLFALTAVFATALVAFLPGVSASGVNLNHNRTVLRGDV